MGAYSPDFGVLLGSLAVSAIYGDWRCPKSLYLFIYFYLCLAGHCQPFPCAFELWCFLLPDKVLKLQLTCQELDPHLHLLMPNRTL